jgi:hypothetical protein
VTGDGLGFKTVEAFLLVLVSHAPILQIGWKLSTALL